MQKLAVFDFDSTLVDAESIECLARAWGVFDEVREITSKAMNGEIDFHKSLVLRVSKLKNMPLELAKEVCENLALFEGATELINALKEKNYKVVCFSGGFDLATNYYRDLLNLDASFSNTLCVENDTLNGLVTGHMMFSHSKGTMLLALQRLLNISKENTLVVGDGANDLSMFKHAHTKIAFNAKEVLKKHATHCINEPNLALIIPYI
ncbi:phosphoserine phosphatase SerB [Helicobacter cetorum]|uniref:Phosphoserine phosphatase n=1 Tax=Helicobacter cetorum (strain ATCC BAA-540 / CCUG 52418 / MIT 99-5656) TaxID=1163745 RepID=I0ETS6_HELCM|nr:phosphoserine phosphatase SerB [Helicobacter cetorum]AFI06345.1 phosphoserine phosphatase [Helicobacter cetorum MIT 99-5656]